MILFRETSSKVLIVGEEGLCDMVAPTRLQTTLEHILYDKGKSDYETFAALDARVIDYIDKNKPRAIIVSLQPYADRMSKCAWLDYAIKRSTPVGIIWYDSITYPDLVEQMSRNCLNIILDDQNYVGKNSICVWTPIMAQIRHPSEERDIDVCFIGKVDCRQREESLRYLIERGVPVFTAGNQNWNRMSHGMLNHYLTRSKIVLNFSLNRFWHPPRTSFKGRVLESMLCGAMVVEDENDNSNKYFVPGKDMVWHKSLPDLHAKLKFYLANENERIKIAMSGQFVCMTELTVNRWWDVVLTRLFNLKSQLKM